MNFINSGHRKNLTINNALLWGISGSHFQQFRVQDKLHYKIAHLAIAIIEAIPVAGQVVSLMELFILGRYKSIQPISCIPKIAKIRLQETPSDACRIWPADLKLLGLTESQKNDIDHHVRQAFRAVSLGGKATFSKKKITYSSSLCSVEAVLPITPSLIVNQTDTVRSRVLLIPKTIFASGGERNIRWAYDLTNGNFLIKKRITGLFEKTILSSMEELRTGRGIDSPNIWRTSTNKQNQPKEQVIESVQDGTLSSLFGTEALKKFSSKKNLIIDLLNDLKDLHSIDLKLISSNSKESHTYDYKAYHSDIKSANILVFAQKEKWRGQLCDFGLASGNFLKYSLSLGYTPPEYIPIYKKIGAYGPSNDCPTTDQLYQFITSHSQGRDVWAMGLAILSLMVEREEEIHFINKDKIHKKGQIPPLPFLKSMIHNRTLSACEEEEILNLKQGRLDGELAVLEKEAISKHPECLHEVAKVFKMIKERMLRINPQERGTVQQCLDFLK